MNNVIELKKDAEAVDIKGKQETKVDANKNAKVDPMDELKAQIKAIKSDLAKAKKDTKEALATVEELTKQVEIQETKNGLLFQENKDLKIAAERMELKLGNIQKVFMNGVDALGTSVMVAIEHSK